MKYVAAAVSTEPVTSSELADHLRLTESDYTAQLNRLSAAARASIENATNRYVCASRTVTLYLDKWPAGRAFEIRKAPVLGVTSVKYRDEDDTQQTLSSDNYWTDIIDNGPARVHLKDSEDWPTDSNSDGYPNMIEVAFTAGYATVPAEVEMAILLEAERMWCNQAGCDCDCTPLDNLKALLSWTGWGKDNVEMPAMRAAT